MVRGARKGDLMTTFLVIMGVLFLLIMVHGVDVLRSIRKQLREDAAARAVRADREGSRFAETTGRQLEALNIAKDTQNEIAAHRLRFANWSTKHDPDSARRKGGKR